MPVSALILSLALLAPVRQEPPKETPAPRPAGYLLKDARVVVRPGQTLPRASVLVEGGQIVAVGEPEAKPGVEVIDCAGLTVYAGFIHPYTTFRTTPAPAAGAEAEEGGPRRQQAQQSAAQQQEAMRRRDQDPFGAAANGLSEPSAKAFTVAELPAFGSLGRSGYGLANASPSLGIFGPRSAAFALTAGKVDAGMAVAEPGFVHVNFSSRGGGGYPTSGMGAIAFARQALHDAGWRIRMRTAGQEVPEAKWLDALGGVLGGQGRFVFPNVDGTTFFIAEKFSREFGLKPVYSFQDDAGYALNQLRPGTTVMLSGPTLAKPTIGDDLSTVQLRQVRGYFNDVQAGARAESAGVPWVYAPSSASRPLEGIRTYVRAGLARDAALAAMTTRPAELLGLADRYGSVEAGKAANLVVTQGDVFDSSSQVMAVLVGGQRLDAAMPERKKPEDLKADPPLALMPPINSVFPRPAETTPAHRLYRNATVWTMGRQGVLKGADVLIRDGKIVAVGRGLSAPQGCEVVDATGKHISPGIWDCHSHTAIWGGVNEGSNMVTIECRISDVINATSQDVYTQLSGGTVGAQQLHGSANAIGGQTSPVKWRWGQTADEFPIAGAPQGVKFALGQNPIREDTGGFGGQATVVGSTLLTWRPRTRMGVEESIRRALQLGREYVQAWADYKAGRRKAEPRRDLQLEGLGEITTGQCLVHSHAYRADEMLMLMRVVPEYGGRIASLQHVLEGYKIADEMAAAQVGGSTFSDWWGFKLESYDAIPHNPGLMAERGVSVSVNSDSGNHARRLNMEAAKSIRYAGTSPEKALSFVTIEPARQMGIGDKTGSLEPGKDADMVVWTDDPTSVFAVCLETYVDGVKRFDRADDARQRAERERELLAAKALLAEAAPAPAPAATTDEAFPTTAKFGIGPITGIPGSARYPRKAVFFDDATVHPMDGEPFVGDVLVGADGMIAAVGKELSPGGATRVNGRGKHLYPGLIDAVTGLGINEIGQVPASDDSSERGDFHPDYRVERTINPEWETLAVARNQGVLTALVRPSGSGASGQAALIHTEGYTWEDITVQGGVALAYGNPFGAMGFGEQDDRCLCEVIETDLGHEGHGHDDDFTSGAAQQQQGGVNAIGQTLTRIADQIKAAKAYEADLAAATPEKPVARDQRHEAILRVARGELPVLVSASTGAEIKAAVEWAEKEGIRMVITGGTAADEVDDWLAKKQVPIAFAGTMTVPPADRPVDHYYSLPARLAKAGVRFCLTTQSDKDVRLLRDQAGWAAAYGLPREDAARSITWWAAQVLGVDDRMGAIKPGLEGTVILTDGEIIEVRSRVLRAWIRGREVSLETKQTRLYDKYRTRPR